MCVIDSASQWDSIMLEKLLGMKEEDPYEFEAYDGPEDMLEDIKDGEWGGYCPYLNSKTMEKIPLKLIDSCKTKPIWRGKCVDINREDVEYIKGVIGQSELPRSIFYDGEINDIGCRGCWAFNYYYVLAWLIDNECFWKL
ncbi:MAG: hypothetical protein ACRCX2_12405 [Paraclostridium sp.]